MKRPLPWPSKRQKIIVFWEGRWCYFARWWKFKGSAMLERVELPADARVRGFEVPRKRVAKMKEPQFEAAATSGDTTPLPDSVLLKKYPQLSELLLQAIWESGNHKGARTVWMCFEGSVVKLMICVKRQKLKAMMSARSLDDVFQAWELALKHDQVPWEQEEAEKPKPAKKRS